MPVQIHGKSYLTVAERIAAFRAEYPLWTVSTELLQCDDTRVVCHASIIDESSRLISTGLAEEQWGASRINKTSAVEVCETSAVGRALAFFKYAGDEIASADEVANAVGSSVHKAMDNAFNSPKMKVWELLKRRGVHTESESKSVIKEISGKDASKMTDEDWQKVVDELELQQDEKDPAKQSENHGRIHS